MLLCYVCLMNTHQCEKCEKLIEAAQVALQCALCVMILAREKNPELRSHSSYVMYTTSTKKCGVFIMSYIKMLGILRGKNKSNPQAEPSRVINAHLLVHSDVGSVMLGTDASLCCVQTFGSDVQKHQHSSPLFKFDSCWHWKATEVGFRTEDVPVLQWGLKDLCEYFSFDL